MSRLQTRMYGGFAARELPIREDISGAPVVLGQPVVPTTDPRGQGL